ncbi:hypothetical protein D3C81_1932790 [compost metagenome]
MPAQKSSSEKRQPSPFNSLMKRMALPRLAMALVSVISKQIIRGGMAYSTNRRCRYSRNLSSPMLDPDRLIAQIDSGPSRPSSRHWRMTRNTLRTTQRSSAVIRP